MSRKKSNFWGSFWQETGRNTGKFTSNKIFGPTGWATPRRHIFDSDNSSSGSRRKSISSIDETYDSSSKSDSTYDWKDERVENIIDMANKISFNSNDVNNICNNLDDLLTGASTANKFINSHKMCNKIFVSKIKSGIMRLRRIQEHELADFYTQELKSVIRSANWSKAESWFYVVIGILMILAINYLLGIF
jgi:hypothetical protein